jgi:hypothetical protein
MDKSSMLILFLQGKLKPTRREEFTFHPLEQIHVTNIFLYSTLFPLTLDRMDDMKRLAKKMICIADNFKYLKSNSPFLRL